MAQICGKTIGPIGYGLMGLTWRETPISDEQAFAAMKAALVRGCNFWNGGEFYGKAESNSLTLLRRYFSRYPEDADKVVLSVKGGINTATLTPDGSEDGIVQSVKNCQTMLGGVEVKKIDTFECARVDKTVPIENTIRYLQAHVDVGDIGGISLSEVSAKTINAAAKVAKIDTVEVELSIWSPDVLRNGVAKACADNGIVLVAYSPLGRGVFTGALKSPSDIPEGDVRRHMPRFQADAWSQNISIIEAVKALAQKKGCTPAQLALGWVRGLAKLPGMPTIIPIPGSTTEARVNENATEIDLTEKEMAEINQLIETHEIVGGRYANGHPIEG